MNKEVWERDCQSFELDFQSKPNYRWKKEEFENAWAKHFMEWCEISENGFINRTVIDIGCGSRPAIDFFCKSVRYYIDPLLDKFVHIPQVAQIWDPEHMHHALGMPAEVRVKLLENSASFINCWNVLDHCYDWREVLDNVCAYARSGCLISLGTDAAPHKGHAGIEDLEELYIRLAGQTQIVKEEPGYWGRQIALLLRKR